MIEREECECVDDGDDCPIPNPSCPLHGDDLQHNYYVTGQYRTFNNQYGIGTPKDFQLEVRADDIESAAKIAEDIIMSDGRRHADSVRDMEIWPQRS